MVKRILSGIVAVSFLLNTVSSGYALAPQSRMEPVTNPEMLDIMKLTAAAIERDAKGASKGRDKAIAITLDKVTNNTAHRDVERPGDEIVFDYRSKMVIGDTEFIPSWIKGVKHGEKAITTRHYLCRANKIADDKYDYEFMPDKGTDLKGLRVADAVQNRALLSSLANKSRGADVKEGVARFVEQQNNTDRIIADAILRGSAINLSRYDKLKLVENAYNFLNDGGYKVAESFMHLVDLGQVMVIPDLRRPHAGGIGIYLNNHDPQTLMHEIFAKCGFSHEDAEKMAKHYTKVSNNKRDNSTSAELIERAKKADFPNRYDDVLNIDFYKDGFQVPAASLKGEERNWFLGIDSSTKSVKFFVIERIGNRNRIIWTHTESFNSPYYRETFGTKDGVLPHPQAPEQYHTDPLMIADALDRGMAQLSRQFGYHDLSLSNLKAIAGAGQQHGTVYLNDNVRHIGLLSLDKPLWETLHNKNVLALPTSPIWQDGTTTGEVADIHKAAGGEQVVRETTGSKGTLRFSLPQALAVFNRSPQTRRDTRVIINIAGWNLGLLCGKLMWDPGDALGTNAAKAKERIWWVELMNRLNPGLGDKFAPIMPSDHIAGRLLEYWVKKYGFSADTKVVNFTGDNPSGLTGMGVIKEGDVVVSLGTSYTAYTFVPNNKLEMALKTPIGHIFGEPTGQYMNLVCFQNGDDTLVKIREKYIPEEEALARARARSIAIPADKKDRDALIAKMRLEIFTEELNNTRPGNDGAMMVAMHKTEDVVRIPFAEGRTFSRGLDEQNRPQVFRAAVEGQAYFLKWVTGQIGLDVKRIRLTGGVSNNPVVRQIMADVFDAEINVLTVSEAVALGSAIRAMKAGLDISWEEAIKGLTDVDKAQTVRPVNAETYRALYPKFVGLLDETVRASRAEEKAAEDISPFNADTLEAIAKGELAFETTDVNARRLAASFLEPATRDLTVSVVKTMQDKWGKEYNIRIMKETFNVANRRARPEVPNVPIDKIELPSFGLWEPGDFESFAKVGAAGLSLETIVNYKAAAHDPNDRSGHTGKTLINWPWSVLPEHRHVDMIVLAKGAVIPEGWTDAAKVINEFAGVLDYNADGTPTGKVLYSVKDYTIAIANSHESRKPDNVTDERYFPGKSETFNFISGEAILFGDRARMTDLSKVKGVVREVPAELRGIAEKIKKERGITAPDMMYVVPGAEILLTKNTRHALLALGKTPVVYEEYSTPSRDEADVWTDKNIKRLYKLAETPAEAVTSAAVPAEYGLKPTGVTFNKNDAVTLTRELPKGTVPTAPEIESATIVPDYGMNLVSWKVRLPGQMEATEVINTSPLETLQGKYKVGPGNEFGKNPFAGEAGAIIGGLGPNRFVGTVANDKVEITLPNGRKVYAPANHKGTKTPILHLHGCFHNLVQTVKSWFKAGKSASIQGQVDVKADSEEWHGPSDANILTRRALDGNKLKTTVVQKNTGVEDDFVSWVEHSYFRNLCDRSNVLMKLPVKALLELKTKADGTPDFDECLPTGNVLDLKDHPYGRFMAPEGGALKNDFFDDAFTGLVPQADGSIVVEILYPKAGVKLRIRAYDHVIRAKDGSVEKGKLKSIQVYSPNDKDFVCVEIGTHLNNPFDKNTWGDRDTGMVKLSPGDTYEYNLEYEYLPIEEMKVESKTAVSAAERLKALLSGPFGHAELEKIDAAVDELVLNEREEAVKILEAGDGKTANCILDRLAVPEVLKRLNETAGNYLAALLAVTLRNGAFGVKGRGAALIETLLRVRSGLFTPIAMPEYTDILRYAESLTASNVVRLGYEEMKELIKKNGEPVNNAKPQRTPFLEAHTKANQYFLVTEGVLNLLVETKNGVVNLPIKKGEAVAVMPGTWHMSVTTSPDTKFIVYNKYKDEEEHIREPETNFKCIGSVFEIGAPEAALPEGIDETVIDLAAAESSTQKTVVFVSQEFAASAEQCKKLLPNFNNVEYVPFNQRELKELPGIVSKSKYDGCRKVLITSGVNGAEMKGVVDANGPAFENMIPINTASEKFTSVTEQKSFQKGVLTIALLGASVPKDQAAYKQSRSYMVLKSLLTKIFDTEKEADDYITNLVNPDGMLTVSKQFGFLIGRIIGPVKKLVVNGFTRIVNIFA